MKTKICTSLEQSKKLAEILPLESADLYYQYVLPKSGKIKHNPEIGNPINALEWYNKGYTTSGKQPITLDEYCVPCWSLAALLDILPDELGDNHFLTLDKEGNEYCCCYEDNNGNSFRHTFADNPVDACYEMILKLHKLNLL